MASPTKTATSNPTRATSSPQGANPQAAPQASPTAGQPTETSAGGGSLLTATPAELDQLLEESLAAFGNLIAWDLAAVYELTGDALVLRAADDVEGCKAPGLVRGRRVRRALAPRIDEALRQGFAVSFDEAEGEFDPYDAELALPRGRHTLVAPLQTGGGPLGALLLTRSKGGPFSGALPELVDVFARLLALAVGFGEQSAALERLRAESEARTRMLAADQGADPKRAATWLENSESPAMQALCRHARRLAEDDSPLLVRGEAGAGKETLARAVHAWSPRREGPFVALRCGSIPRKELARRLYGDARGEVGALRAASGGGL